MFLSINNMLKCGYYYHFEAKFGTVEDAEALKTSMSDRVHRFKIAHESKNTSNLFCLKHKYGR